MPVRQKTQSKASGRARRSQRAPRPVQQSPTTQPPSPAQAARNAAHQPSPAEILQLQRSVGNQAARRLVGQTAVPVEPAAEGVVQRKASSGLASKKSTNAFAQKAFDFWTTKANQAKPLKDLSDHLLTEVNAMLGHAANTAYNASGASGTFGRTTWTITVNTAGFSKRAGVTTVGDLNKDEVANIVDTIYHEARHAEQYFRIARIKAGEGMNAAAIKTYMSIPATVAAAAVADPLKGTSRANKKLIAEAAGWEQITVGKYGVFKGEINTFDDQVDNVLGSLRSGTLAVRIAKLGVELGKAGNSLTGYFDPEKTRIDALPKRDKYDRSARKHIVKIRKKFDALKTAYDAQKGDLKKVQLKKLWKLAWNLHKASYGAYRSHLHEKDAWGVGEAAGKRLKRLAKKVK